MAGAVEARRAAARRGRRCRLSMRERPRDRQQRGEQHRRPRTGRARPGARIPRSGSSANANSRITISPNGRICCAVTRDRASIRRSLPATSAASRQRFTRHPDRSTSLGVGDRLDAGPRRAWPAAITTSRVGERPGVLELVRRHQHGPALGRARRRRPRRAPRGPRRRGRRGARRAAGAADRATSATASARRRRCPAESRRWTTSATAPRPRRSSAASASSVVAARRRGRRSAGSPARSGRRSRRSRGRRGRGRAGRPCGRRRGRGRAPRLARVQRHQAGEQAQQRGLARAVRAREQHDLARGGVEVDAGQRREAPEEADGGAETDDGRHTRLRDGRIGAGVYGAVRRGGRTGDAGAADASGVSLRGHAHGCSGPSAACLVTVGLLLLLFVAYQLWGTGHLRGPGPERPRRTSSSRRWRSTARRPRRRRRATTAPATRRPRTTTLAPLAAPARGRRGRPHRHPKIGLDQYVVEGVDVADLRKGPGHYPSTRCPARRATPPSPATAPPTAPVRRSRPARAGDEIGVVDRPGRRSTYKVTEQTRGRPERGQVLDPDRPTPHARPPARDPHAHHLQPEVLGRAAPHRPGPARAARRARLPLPPTQVTDGNAGHDDRRAVGRVVVADARRSSGASSPLASGCCGGCCSTATRAGRRGSIGVVPFLAALFVCLHVPRAPAAVELLTDGRSRLVDQRDDLARRDRVAGLDVELAHDAGHVGDDHDATRSVSSTAISSSSATIWPSSTSTRMTVPSLDDRSSYMRRRIPAARASPSVRWCA